MSIMNMFLEHCIKDIWKHLSMKSTWDIQNTLNMFHGNACVKHLINQDHINKLLKSIVETTCSVYNIRSYEILGEMHVNKY